MTNDIFISYSRRDTEFVARLASDLDAQVAGVWFDQSAIQLGQKWHDEIMDGIRECKAFILVLSPDAAESKYVREEVNKALELGKTIFPVIYRAGKWTGEFETLVKEVQTLDLRSGSYTESFHKLVDGLIEAGAIRATGERPFLRQTAKVGMNVVLSKVPGWAFAWGLGWLVFWIIGFIIILIVNAMQGSTDNNAFLTLITLLVSGGIGGFAGGLIAGLFSMLALRPNAPSISWKHMSPTIRIWGISGPLGIIVSGLIAYLSSLGFQGADPNCDGGLGDCVGSIIGTAIGNAIALAILLFITFLLFALIAWFLTGMFAGWQAVRHIRRLEPGITSRQSRNVTLGWGCGAIVAAVVMILVLGVLSSALGL